MFGAPMTAAEAGTKLNVAGFLALLQPDWEPDGSLILGRAARELIVAGSLELG